MKFQLKRNRVQCYRQSEDGLTMITSIPIGTHPSDIDMTDNRNKQLTSDELDQYSRWFEKRERKKQKERNEILEVSANISFSNSLNYIEKSLKSGIDNERKDQLLDLSEKILKKLDPDRLNPKITLKTYLKSLLSQ